MWPVCGSESGVYLGYLLLALLQIFLATLIRAASWQPVHDQEEWTFFPAVAPAQGLPLVIKPQQ